MDTLNNRIQGIPGDQREPGRRLYDAHTGRTGAGCICKRSVV